ncbi:hypothetical protein EV2_017838 [Malus domestica]
MLARSFLFCFAFVSVSSFLFYFLHYTTSSSRTWICNLVAMNPDKSFGGSQLAPMLARFHLDNDDDDDDDDDDTHPSELGLTGLLPLMLR